MSRRSCGASPVSTWAVRLRDETTILNFRHLLEQHDLCGQVLDAVNLYLASRGIPITIGTIVDATIIQAPSLTLPSECVSLNRPVFGEV
jgi:IS5 family transposase